MTSQTLSPEIQKRQDWLRLLASTPEDKLETYVQENLPDIPYSYLREPEIGLVMVRARAGGNGRQFNMGEVSVARCSVTLTNQVVGHGYVKGRSKRHAELIALLDATFQDRQPDETFLQDLKRACLAKREQLSRKAAATKVDFYTIVRGED
ncbi:phosphonate C-P lyase system protein PhnG [Sneathiella limimaris]|uniref:phosphonate C-P lyase system protein PhnG n=1 Tax=Sneathiella limimaris TaxID=1964213 RepID=UPI00146DE2C9|nr:phosphonate C-P lyase system protein PhnG [Sneathiella limimaris]